MQRKNEPTPERQESPKRLLIITQSANSPKTKPLVDFFLTIKKTAIKYIDHTSECLPTIDNTATSNGKLEETMKRLKASLFVYITTTKSQQLTLIFGRTYEYQLTDLAKFTLTTNPSTLSTLPLPTYSLALLLVANRAQNPRIQNLLLDLYKEALPPSPSISICTHAIALSFTNDSFSLTILKIQSSPFSLQPISPTLNFTFQASHHSAPEVFQESQRTIRQAPKKIKNIEKGPLNTIIGTLHLEKQDLSELKLSKGRALRKHSP
ncbi:ribosome production factor 2 [Nematocida homosporus]|uniref:ribosome production factor 2 n=1 Tax=Nematocida homosporus TaxID=1912981 RepID=UPI00221FD785|nr:ribosome production factor 2 [Nematocida homosporus]KAI5187054.1 ribosome production factor 2 [Nematocida homosporus]